MSKIKLTGHASGTGVLTVTAPNTSTDRTITLPDTTGTLLTTTGSCANLTGISSVGGATGVDFNYNVKARFGTNNDLEIYHDHANSQNVQLSTSIPITFAANDLKFANGLNDTLLMKIDNDGHITAPKQPAFQARMSNRLVNFSTNTVHTLAFDSEVFDNNADFNTSNYTFTAPVTGKYQLNTFFRLEEVPNDASYVHLYFTTSNITYYDIIDPRGFDTSVAYWNLQCSVLADMDANDTAKVKILQPNGTAQTDIASGSDSHFSGYLVC